MHDIRGKVIKNRINNQLFFYKKRKGGPKGLLTDGERKKRMSSLSPDIPLKISILPKA